MDQKSPPRWARIGAAIVLLVALGGCESLLPEPHKIDIQQGNDLKQEDVDRLYTGMSRQDVLQLLGKPLLADPFHPERWDYIYRLKPGKGELVTSRLTLKFDNDQLISIDRSEFSEHESNHESERDRNDGDVD